MTTLLDPTYPTEPIFASDLFGRPIQINDEVIVPKYNDFLGITEPRFGRVIKKTKTKSGGYVIVRFNLGQGSKRGSKIYDTGNIIIADLYRKHMPELFL